MGGAECNDCADKRGVVRVGAQAAGKTLTAPLSNELLARQNHRIVTDAYLEIGVQQEYQSPHRNPAESHN